MCACVRFTNLIHAGGFLCFDLIWFRFIVGFRCLFRIKQYLGGKSVTHAFQLRIYPLKCVLVVFNKVQCFDGLCLHCDDGAISSWWTPSWWNICIETTVFRNMVTKFIAYKTNWSFSRNIYWKWIIDAIKNCEEFSLSECFDPSYMHIFLCDLFSSGIKNSNNAINHINNQNKCRIINIGIWLK